MQETEAMVTAQERGARMLTAEEMSQITGINEQYLQDCITTGNIDPSTHACEITEFAGGQEKEAKAAKDEGTPWFPKVRKVTAEEIFARFWKSTVGKERICNPVFVRQVHNQKRGFPADYAGAATEREVEKLIANVFSKMKDDGEIEVLTSEKFMDAKESA